jgi:hypothetical protein
MAQHIPIRFLKQKIFRKIEDSIKRDFEVLRNFSGSLKYERDSSGFHRAHENQEVYFTQRYIGYDKVCGTDKGDFEIHYNWVTKKVEELFLVA